MDFFYEVLSMHIKKTIFTNIDHNLIRIMINPIDNVMFIEKWNCYVKVFANYVMGVVFMYLEALRSIRAYMFRVVQCNNFGRT
jgi:hypothetical protein